MNAPPTIISWAVYLLLNLTLLGASLAIGVTLAFRFIPTSLPRTRYSIALVVFCAASLLPILATMGVSIRQPANLTRPETASRAITPDNTIVVNLAPSTKSASPMPTSFQNWIPDLARRVNKHPLAAALLWLWLSVSALLLSRELIGHLSLWRARRKWELAGAALQQELNWPCHIPLYLHPHSGPSTIGWLRPAVILPQRLWSELPPTAIRQVAQHELAHARWRDPLVNALLRIIRALLWPSLPLWFLEYLTHTEREAAADQAAIADGRAQLESNQSALDYAASLVSIAAWKPTAAARSFNPFGTQVGGRKALEKRVHRLLKTSPRLSPARFAMGIIVLLGGFIGLGWLPIAVADQSARRDRAEKFQEAWRGQMATFRATGSAIKQLPEEPAKEPRAATKSNAMNREKYQAWQQEIEAVASQVVIVRDGSTVLIRQTSSGAIEEPILRFRQAEIEAYAIKRVVPSETDQIVRESGLPGVMVHVVVDETGKVILAWPLGNDRPFIKQQAVEAARQWKFTPIMKDGQPKKAVGTLAFFGTPDWSKEWYAIRF